MGSRLPGAGQGIHLGASLWGYLKEKPYLGFGRRREAGGEEEAGGGGVGENLLLGFRRLPCREVMHNFVCSNTFLKARTSILPVASPFQFSLKKPFGSRFCTQSLFPPPLY